MSKILLKDQLLNEKNINSFLLEIHSKYPQIKKQEFIKNTLRKFKSLELKERISCIEEELHRQLPKDFTKTIAIFDKILEGKNTSDFIYAPLLEYVQKRGCTQEHLNTSLKALLNYTSAFSAEFAIRDFLNNFPKETIQILEKASKSQNQHQRRLASEGIRPKLPWAKAITTNYKEPIPLLIKLSQDPERYVTRSVSNHINDISKIDPLLAINTIKEIQKNTKIDPKELSYIQSHSLRTLIKNGNPQALELLGINTKSKITITNLRLSQNSIRIGKSIELNFSIKSPQNQDIIIDYIIGHVRKNGSIGKKTYKLKKIKAKKDELLNISKAHTFQNLSTRTINPGTHTIEVMINSQVHGPLKLDISK